MMMEYGCLVMGYGLWIMNFGTDVSIPYTHYSVLPYCFWAQKTNIRKADVDAGPTDVL